MRQVEFWGGFFDLALILGHVSWVWNFLVVTGIFHEEVRRVLSLSWFAEVA